MLMGTRIFENIKNGTGILLPVALKKAGCF